MNLPKPIHLTLITLVIINSIVCDKIDKSNLLAKLLNVVNKNLSYKKPSLEEIFQNKILVKRPIPHGHGVSKPAYDSKFNTYYKPLVRVHQPKLVRQERERNTFVSTALKAPQKRIRNVLYNDEALFQPFQVITPRKVTFKSILEDVITYVSKVDSAKELRRLKYAILTVLENYPNTLRHKYSTGSDEKLMQNLLFQDENSNNNNNKPPPKKKWLPSYPFWNYWTYDKTIRQDVCKGKLVQMGNQCWETPPH